MIELKKLLTIGLCCAFAAGSADAAGSRRRHYPRYARQQSAGCPIHYAVDGTPVDCHGWRYRDNYGWDNSCFNLDYLSSQFACGAHNGY